MEVRPPQSAVVHDLLALEPSLIESTLANRAAPPPAWVVEALRRAPFAVVRREPATAPHQVAVGVRGVPRAQRWAWQIPASIVRRVVTPGDLLRIPVSAERRQAIPAFRSLQVLKDRWAGTPLPWGPGGSIAFELLSGLATASAGSDLDIVLRAERPIPRAQAAMLCEQARGLPSAVDLRVETPHAGFSLQEYARGDGAQVLLRTPLGARLAANPWTAPSSPGSRTPAETASP